jgi:hypothetical protein
MACSRSALTWACSTITQRQPRLCAAAASARPWLPSVALMTDEALQRGGVPAGQQVGAASPARQSAAAPA